MCWLKDETAELFSPNGLVIGWCNTEYECERIVLRVRYAIFPTSCGSEKNQEYRSRVNVDWKVSEGDFRILNKIYIIGFTYILAIFLSGAVIWI